MALRFDLPILAGPGGGRPLSYEVREVEDGETINDGDVRLAVITTPGPRPDHVAYTIESDGGAPVVIAGDLVGPRADRAVLGPVDEAARAASIERLIALRAALLLPGHGEPLPPDALVVSSGVTPPGSAGS
jgi:glyoxylase-like metal-dependent hydrolase (beta-lactamase superfamily II)